MHKKFICIYAICTMMFFVRSFVRYLLFSQKCSDFDRVYSVCSKSLQNLGFYALGTILKIMLRPGHGNAPSAGLWSVWLGKLPAQPALVGKSLMPILGRLYI